MYNACSTTARRGALGWAPVFEAANRPVFEKLYKSVRDGTETRKALVFNGRSTYRQDLARELKEIDEQEIWDLACWQDGSLAASRPQGPIRHCLTRHLQKKTKICGHLERVFTLE